jgi:hypothetical protein
VCPSTEVELQVFLDHVIRHPLGALHSQGVAWNQEGWDKTEPPTVTAAERDAIVASVRELRAGAKSCVVFDAEGAWKKLRSVQAGPCCSCDGTLVKKCVPFLLADGSVGQRYGKVTAEMLGELSKPVGVQVERRKFFERMNKAWNVPRGVDGLSVLTVGLDASRQCSAVVRISRFDGIRSEFYLQEPNRLAWRTTYRQVEKTSSVSGQISFLSQVPLPKPLLALSELCVVSRHWWERYGK